MRLYPFILAAACLAAPAPAQSVQDDRRSMSVSLANVRFGNPQSVAELHRRIDKAVREVCMPDGRTLHEHMQSQSCRIDAQKDSERQLARIAGQARMAAVEPR